jgi:phytoene dehydrogenase-like protein
VEAYDAAVIGAGVEGLAAGAILSRAGLRTIVCERNAEPGGRCQTTEFHPGFRASPFCDEIAAIPSHLFWSLDLASHGALLASPTEMTALWPDRVHTCRRKDSRDPMRGLLGEARERRRAVMARAARAALPRSWWRLGPPAPSEPWPSEDWAHVPLAEVVSGWISDCDMAAHAMAVSLSGRAADPVLNGTALHLLAPPDGSGVVRGGLGGLTKALVKSAEGAGVTISRGLEVTDIRHQHGRVTGLALADGEEIVCDSIVAALDLKRAFLSLFKWEALPRATVQRVNLFRSAAATARLLVALDRLPERSDLSDALRGPIAIVPSAATFGQAYAAFKSGILPEEFPLTLRFVSCVDPSLAPDGKATMTATIGCIPHRFFDGAWTHARRDQLRDRALHAVENVLPGATERILGLKLIVPPDIEEAIGRTDGDLSGGEIAPDQMLGMRPWTAGGPEAPRTALKGFYIAGPSTTAGTLASCASGAAAAEAILADRSRGWLR